MEKKLLIIGDPVGNHSLIALRKYAPENIWVWENDPRHFYTIKQIDAKINVTTDLQELVDKGMKFDVIIGNPPYNRERNSNNKAKNSNNSLYIDFINMGVELLKSGGVMSLITPPSALTKGTTVNRPTKTLNLLTSTGNLRSIDYTVRDKHFSTVGNPICRWVYKKGERQGDITIVHEDNDISGVRPVSDIYYLPDSVSKKNKPNFIEFNLYRKIVTNKEGRSLHVIRSDKRLKLDGTICTFGYPNVTLGGGEGRLNYKAEDHEFLVSNLGLWFLDYLRRTDQQLSHLQLNGIIVPEGGYVLTDEESEFIENGNWKNSAN